MRPVSPAKRASPSVMVCSMNHWALLQNLAQAERHIAEGVVHLARQESLIADLDRAGHDSDEARTILDTLAHTQLLHEQDREHLLSLVLQAQCNARAERPKTCWPESIRQEDAQRWARLWEMEQRASELLSHPAPDTFLGRQHSASILVPAEQP